MATRPDKVFVQSYTWLRDAVAHLQAVAALPPADKTRVDQLLWKLLGLIDAASPLPAPAAITLEAFQGGGTAAQGLSQAALIAAEFLVALDTIKAAVDAIQGGGATADLFKLVGQVVQQADAIVKGVAPAARYPSAFGLAKLLLMLSGDARATVAAGQSQAQQLASFVARSTVGGNPSQAQTDAAAAALGLFVTLVGALLDRSFEKPLDDPGFGWQPGTLASVLPAGTLAPIVLAFGDAGPTKPKLSMRFAPEPAPAGVAFDASIALNALAAAGPAQVKIQGSTALQVYQPLLPPGPARVEGAGPQISIQVSKQQSAGFALQLGPVALGGFASASLQIKTIGAGITLALKNAALQPRFDVFLRDGEIKLTLEDTLLKEVLAGDIRVDFEIAAELDGKGKLHLKDGSGLRVSLPVPKLPSGPLKLQLIHLGIAPVQGTSFEQIDAELSASFAVALGPFKGSVDRLGVIVKLRDLFGGAPSVSFGVKPPNGVGLSLDAGIVSGGGYITLDPDKGEYAGVLELKIMAIGIKAIAILNTKLPGGGWSLLLLIFGNFPPIQLSFGFTLTGLGGLIGLQLTTDTDALSRGLATGALDAILFPANPVADAPQIINTLRTIFPAKRGGFIIGPMVEVGWGTPNLVTIRAGVLIETSKIVIIGQALVQIPPLVDKDLAILRLQVDFAGYIIFDPFKLGFDGRLRDSRVLFITLTGSFAFRASFGDKPSFLLSAGGFHPQFKDIPDDVPAMDRIGAGFSIGIIGVKFEGYFAVTSATVQGGSNLQVWADIGIASFDGGFGYDVIVYLEPRFHFDAEMRLWAKIDILGFTLGARIEGLLSGPGQWHAAGQATVDLGFFGEHSVDFDERWGNAADTPVVLEAVEQQLALEIAKTANWSAQLPSTKDAFVSLAKIDGATDILAHPRSPLTFRQKYIPLDATLKRLGSKRPSGPNRFSAPALTLPGGGSGFPSTLVKEHFAAAQFFDVTEQDRLQGPSFEQYDAGITVAVDSFESGTFAGDSFDFEEVNLSADAPKLLSTVHLGALVDPAWLYAFGGAARSEMRNRLQPKVLAKAAVAPPAYHLSERSTAQLASAASSYSSAKHQLSTLGVAEFQVAEAFEALV